MKKKIAILGSTGSIGTQALEVIESNPEHFELVVITAQANANLLIEQAVKFKPNAVVIGDERRYHEVDEALKWKEEADRAAKEHWMVQTTDEQISKLRTLLS